MTRVNAAFLQISLQNHQKQLSEFLAVYLRRNKLDIPLSLFSVCIISVCFADKILAPFNRQWTCRPVDSSDPLLNYRAFTVNIHVNGKRKISFLSTL
jgi:hypothetical protein